MNILPEVGTGQWLGLAVIHNSLMSPSFAGFCSKSCINLGGV